MTLVVRVDRAHPEEDAIARAAGVLRRGGLVAFPTETVYGLGAHALDPRAVARVFEAKGRPSTDPLIVHVATLDDVAPLVRELPDVAAALGARFWPGPLTLVLPRSAAVPDEVTAGLATVAVRVPAHPVARALLAAARLPVAAPSANLFSRPSPTRASHVLEDLDGRIDLILDGGATDVGVESTVIDVTGDVPTVLRPGATTLEMLREVVPDVRLRAPAAPAADAAMPSPGLLDRHYSPRAELRLFSGDEAGLSELARSARAELARGRRLGILAADEDALDGLIGPQAGGPEGPPLRARIVRLGPVNDLPAVATRLYAALREMDAAEVELILARTFPADAGLGLAIADRLRRASAR